MQYRSLDLCGKGFIPNNQTSEPAGGYITFTPQGVLINYSSVVSVSGFSIR